MVVQYECSTAGIDPGFLTTQARPERRGGYAIGVICDGESFDLGKYGCYEGVGVFVAETDYAEGSDLVAKTGEMIAYGEVFI